MVRKERAEDVTPLEPAEVEEKAAPLFSLLKVLVAVWGRV